MKSKSFFAWLLAGVMLVMCMGCAETEVAEKPYIAVITKSTESAFWQCVRKGAQAAATEYNITMTFEGPGTEEDYQTQNVMIREAAKNGANAIVLSAIDYHNNAAAVDAAAKSGVKFIVIDSDVNSQNKAMFIGTDNYDAGRRAAQAALQAAAGEKKVRIGLVNYLANTENGRQREKGVRDCIAEHPAVQIVETVNVDSDSTAAAEGACRLMRDHPEINVLIGFNEWTTLGVGYAIRKEKKAGTVHGVGFDSNTVCLGMLETGDLDSLIVQNPFAIGYLGIANAARLVSGRSLLPDTVTEVAVVNRDNMFDPDMQKRIYQFS